MSLIFKWLLNTLFILIIPYILKGINVANLKTAILAAMFLGLLNSILKPILNLLALPINILTLGLFSLVINGFIVILVTKLVPGFSLVNFWYAILFAIALSIFNWIIK